MITQRRRIHLAQGEQINSPAQQQQAASGNQSDGCHDGDFRVGNAGEAAEQPVNDGRKLRLRIRYILGQAYYPLILPLLNTLY
jgi:hypothetical protein